MRRATRAGGRPSRTPAGAGTEDVLHELATGATTGDATLAEQAAAYRARTGRRLSPSTPCRALRRLCRALRRLCRALRRLCRALRRLALTRKKLERQSRLSR
jgi:hypothetical protein